MDQSWDIFITRCHGRRRLLIVQPLYHTAWGRWKKKDL